MDGSSNVNNWKARVIAILEENDIDHFVTTVVAEHTTNVGKTVFKRNQAKARRIIYDSVKEHILPIITPLKTAKECFHTLVKLYEAKAPSHKRLLKSQLRSLKMGKDEFVNSFFTKISHLKDQLLAIGVNVEDDYLLQRVVDGISSTWEYFLVAINGHEVQPNFERLWYDGL